MLVAVAHPRLEDLQRRGEAHGGLLLDDRVHVADEPLGPGAWIVVGGGHSSLGLAADGLGVALDEGLGAEERRRRGVDGAGLELTRIPNLDDAVHDLLPGAPQVGTVEPVGALEADAEEGDGGGVVDAGGGRGHDGRGLEEVGLDLPGHRQGLSLLAGLADHHEAGGALLAHHLADIGDPVAGHDAREVHLHPKCRHRPTGDADDLPGLHHDLHRRVAQGGGVEDVHLVGLSRLEAPCGQGPGQVQRQRGRLVQLAGLGPFTGGVGYRDVQLPAVHLARDPGGSGAGIEGEIETAEGEGAVDHRDAGEPDRGGGAEQGHLEATVLTDLVPVLGRQGLADREADLVAAVVDALPVRGAAVVGQVGGQGHRCGEVGLPQEHAHLQDPGGDRQDRERPGQSVGEGGG